MPGGQTKFCAAWLYVDNSSHKISEWCQKRKDDYHGYCSFCDTGIRCDNAGKAQLITHTVKKKHKKAVKHSQDKKPMKLLFPVSQAGQSSSTASAAKSAVLINHGDVIG